MNDPASAIDEKYRRYKNYCIANMLKINSNKTHILVPKYNHRRGGLSNLKVVWDG